MSLYCYPVSREDVIVVYFCVNEVCVFEQIKCNQAVVCFNCFTATIPV